MHTRHACLGGIVNTLYQPFPVVVARQMPKVDGGFSRIGLMAGEVTMQQSGRVIRASSPFFLPSRIRTPRSTVAKTEGASLGAIPVLTPDAADARCPTPLTLTTFDPRPYLTLACIDLDLDLVQLAIQHFCVRWCSTDETTDLNPRLRLYEDKRRVPVPTMCGAQKGEARRRGQRREMRVQLAALHAPLFPANLGCRADPNIIRYPNPVFEVFKRESPEIMWAF
ncbi:hypothetical protein B0H13DRAFT_1858633 [Mycena leptocephala]|nr:hypothetical protein B0H13DRAFT_1858633 [Mycena leptocephala]